MPSRSSEGTLRRSGPAGPCDGHATIGSTAGVPLCTAQRRQAEAPLHRVPRAHAACARVSGRRRCRAGEHWCPGSRPCRPRRAAPAHERATHPLRARPRRSRGKYGASPGRRPCGTGPPTAHCTAAPAQRPRPFTSPARRAHLCEPGNAPAARPCGHASRHSSARELLPAY